MYAGDAVPRVCGGPGVVDILFYVPPVVFGGSVLVFVLVLIILCPF